jgi:hypothetical protein
MIDFKFAYRSAIGDTWREPNHTTRLKSGAI